METAAEKLTMSEEQKNRLGDKYISEGSGVTDNETQTKYKICKIEDDGILLKQISSFSNHPKPEIKVSFDEFLRKYDAKEISINGYTHEVPDQIILHQVVNDIMANANIGKLTHVIGELTIEEMEFKSGGVVGKISFTKSGHVREIRNQYGKIIAEVKVGDKTYRRNPTYKTYNSVDGNELLYKSDADKIQIMKSGGIANQYEGKTPEEIWKLWTPEQKIHFINDHNDEIQRAWKFAGNKYSIINPIDWTSSLYSELPDAIKYPLLSHIKNGQYKKGAKIKAKEIDFQEEAKNMIGREVYANQSYLIEKLLSSETIPIDDIQNYYRPAEEGEEEEQPQDIMEWWLISDWLKEKLLEQGEPIIDNDLGTWWGRTTSGQAIYMDGVIQKIVKEINSRKKGGKAGTAPKEDEGYQGWKNYETWNVKLWLDNDAGSQAYWDERAAEIAKESKKDEYSSKKDVAIRTLADELKEYHEENNPLADQASTYSDLLGSALDNVSWREIAENLLSEKMKWSGGEMKEGGGVDYDKLPEYADHYLNADDLSISMMLVSNKIKTDKEQLQSNVFSEKDRKEIEKSIQLDENLLKLIGQQRIAGSKKFMKSGGEVGREFRYLKLIPKDNGLEIQLTEEGIEKMKEDGLSYENASDYFEDVQGNSEYLYHPNMGDYGFGLTGAEGITDGYHPSEDVYGEYETEFPESAKVYWFPNYEMKFWGDVLAEEGSVFFNLAKEMKQGGRPDVTKNYYRFRQQSPANVTECAVPMWAQKVAEATKKGAKITTCKKDGKWMVQSILIPKQGVKSAEAKQMADEIKAKFSRKKKALGGIAETCTCDDIEKTITGLEALRDTTDDASEKKRYQELIDELN